MSLKDRISLNVIEYCKNNNITMDDLAKRLHCGLPKITKMLDIKERTRRFTLNDIDNISNALGITPEALITYDKRKRDD